MAVKDSISSSSVLQAVTARVTRSRSTVGFDYLIAITLPSLDRVFGRLEIAPAIFASSMKKQECEKVAGADSAADEETPFQFDVIFDDAWSVAMRPEVAQFASS